MMYFYLGLAFSLGVGAGAVVFGMISYAKGERDGWNAAYSSSTDEDPHIGIGA